MFKIYKKSKKKVSQIKNLEKESWIHFTKPSEDDLKYLKEISGLDEDHVESIMDENELPRYDIEDDYTFFLIQAPYKKGTQILTNPLGIIFKKTNVISVCGDKLDILDDFFSGIEEFSLTKKEDLLLSVFQVIEDRYDSYLNLLSKKVKNKKINIKTLKNKDIVDLVEIEDELNNLMSSMFPNANLYEKFRKSNIIKKSKDGEDLIQELLISTKQNQDYCKSIIKTVQNVRNAYSTILSNNLNKIMKLLTSVTIIMTVPTLVASIYGMNIVLPYQNSPLIFFHITIFTILLIVVLGFIFYKIKWF